MKDDNYGRSPLSDAMGRLAGLIWGTGGFRFHVYASVAQGKQDVPRMERFKCQSKLILKLSLEQHTLDMSMYHRSYILYFDR
jgi:hypothetical protein